MEYCINNNEECFDARNIKITIGNKEFRITVNNYDELVINKIADGDESSNINIIPYMGNEIRIF